MRKKIISIVLAIAMVATMCVSLTACGTTKIELEDYVSASFEGYNGYGYAYSSFDMEAFENDFANLKFTSAGIKDNPYATSPVDTLAGFLANNGYIDYVYGSLSNGDEVTYKWIVNDDDIETLNNDYNIDLNFDNITFTVQGLKEIQTFDAFDGVSVSCSGIAPDGSATLISDGKISSYEFSIEPSYGLSNGDIVTVTLDESDTEYYIDMYGAVPAEFSKEFTVEGLPSYISELSQIPEDGLNKMDAQARDAYSASIASSNYSEYESIASMDLLGCYLLTPKEGFSTRVQNDIYLVYQINMTIHNKDANGNVYDTPFSFYRYYEFTDGMILADGTFSIDYSDYNIPSADVETTAYDYTERWEWNQDVNFGYYGYDNLDTLFNNVVTQNIENFNYEDSVAAEQN